MKKRAERNLRFRNGRWWVDYRVVIGREMGKMSGKAKIKYRRVRESFGSKDEALEVLDKVRAKRRAERRMKSLGIVLPAEQSKATFEEIANKVLARHSSTKRSQTARCHRLCLAWLLKVPHFAGRRMADIRTEEIEDYLANRRTEAKVSANRELAFLKLVFKKAVQWGEILANPTAAVSMTKEPETKIRILTDEEAKGLISAAPGRIKPLLEVLLSTGLRKSEAMCAQWEYPGWELDPKATIVSLEKRAIHVPGTIAKNHKTRVIPMSGRLFDLFRELQATSKNGSVFGMRSFTKSFKSAAVKAGLRGLTIHALRHTAASRMLEAGVDVMSVSQLLGHSDLKITMRYLHPKAEQKRAAIEMLSAAFGPVIPAKGRCGLKEVKISKGSSSKNYSAFN
jgi:integrase